MIRCRPLLVAAAVLLSVGIAARAVEPVASEIQPSTDDTRRLVNMPAAAQQLLRNDMLDHLVVLNQLLAYLAASEFQQASELAEARLGKSSMGKHRGTGMGPGRFMPPEMHQLGIAMHQSASEFAAALKNQESAEAYSGLQRVTGYCVACHMSFRVR